MPRPSRPKLEKFLIDHDTYHGGHDHGATYSRCIKISHLPVPNELHDTAYAMIDQDEAQEQVNDEIANFRAEWGDAYTIVRSGRSGGYLCLLRSSRIRSRNFYQSRCTRCGQGNHTRWYCSKTETNGDQFFRVVVEHVRTIYEISMFVSGHRPLPAYLTQYLPHLLPDAAEMKALAQKAWTLRCELGSGDHGTDPIRFSSTGCGVCRHPVRRNIEKRPTELEINWREGMACGEEAVRELEYSDLIHLHKVVQSFDQYCEFAVQNYIGFCRDHRVVEKEIMVPKKIMVVEEV